MSEAGGTDSDATRADQHATDEGTATARDLILREFLELLDARAEVDLEALKARHPGHGDTIEGMWLAAMTYRDLAGSATGAGTHLLRPGDLVGDFEVQELLARGGFGQVYRATQRSLGRRLVALKVMPAGSTKESTRTRFRREALALAGLHHANLAEVYGVGEERGLLFYAMQLIEGCTLAAVLESLARRVEPLAPEEQRTVVRWVAEVADALAAVHAAGLIHRDVKPANIIIAGPMRAQDDGSLPEGTAVLVDFGLARAIDPQVRTLATRGPLTPEYAAPEQLLDLEADARADVFALGVTLHDLLTRRLCHERSQASAGLEPLGQLLPLVDRDLEAIVGKAADPQARWRYADASALHADLLAWLERRTVSARRPALGERLARWARGHPARFVRRLTAVIVTVALIIVALGSWSEARAAAARARQAFMVGDVLETVAALRLVPATWQWAVLDDTTLSGLAQRVATSDPNDPILRMVDRLRFGDANGAVAEAAHVIAVRGLDGEPLARNFLVASLHSDRQESGTVDALRSETLHYAARLAYEQPAESLAEQESAESLREPTLRLLARSDLSLDDHLNILTLFSGWGHMTDAPSVLEWAAGNPVESESRRLGLVTVERILRRAHGLGTLRSVDQLAVRSHLVSVAHETILAMTATSDRVPFWSKVAVTKCVRAACFAQRAIGIQPDVESVLLDEPGNAEDCWLGHFREQLLGFTTRRDALERILTDPHPPPDETNARSWARIFSTTGSSDLLQRARDVLNATSAGAEAALALFDAESQRAAQEVAGQIEDEALDPETRLAAGSCDADGLPIACDPVDLAAALPQLAGLDYVPGRLISSAWNFHRVVPSIEGGARAAWVRCATHSVIDEGPCLRFFSSGSSMVRLSFDAEASPAAYKPALVLLHQMGARPYFPYLGCVYLEIRLDDALVGGEVQALDSGIVLQQIDLSDERLTPGPHELTIKLHAASTSTCRLYGVAISWIPQPPLGK